MERKTLLLFVVCLLSTFVAASAQTPLLRTTNGTAAGDLYSIDPNTGAAMVIAPLVDNFTNTYAVTRLAFDNLTGVLYGSTSFQSPTGSKSLVSINHFTGAVTFIGSFSDGDTMAALTFDTTTATLYGMGSQDENLYSIMGNISAIAFDASGTLSDVNIDLGNAAGRQIWSQ
jgi:hypothetical protein